MIVSIRGQHRPFLLYGGAQIAILVVAAHVGTREAWYAALPLVAAASFWAWVANFRRYRAVGDTPTSTVASAAQGYVELLGRAYNHPGLPIYAKLSRKPCCWFRFEVEERDHEGTWRTVESGESAATFLLRDHTGECTVDPEGAEVVCTHKERRDIASDRRYTEWRIHEGDTLYVLGEFRTRTFPPRRRHRAGRHTRAAGRMEARTAPAAGAFRSRQERRARPARMGAGARRGPASGGTPAP